jgi:hypothetical protein
MYRRIARGIEGDRARYSGRDVKSSNIFVFEITDYRTNNVVPELFIPK